ncbi:hypothetical protein [Sulfurimonas sp.]|uniref:hypothetical protein n=1 Tax=Sulfurimonas sp. TaxID=2022749 RepID=UPI003457659A
MDWFESHAQKHKKIVEKLQSKEYTKEQIIDYFDFENMKKHEVDFCPLYKENKKCHDMKSLNCYMCACPNFRFSDDGISKYNEQVILSECDINNGKKFSGGGFIHQDCSSCTVPHHRAYILKNFSYDWREMMSECKIK